MHARPFELLELPDGRWCVARLATSEASSGSDPVGFYDTRDQAELAIMRSSPSHRAALAPFAQWLRQG
jgi:hypothetical protein